MFSNRKHVFGMPCFLTKLSSYEENMTIVKQVLNMLSSLGEIAKLPNGYYLPLPERVVELPVSKNRVLLSSTQGRGKELII